MYVAPARGFTSSAWRQLASRTRMATQVLNQSDALDSRDGACPSNTIRYDVCTEYYRILSSSVKSAPLGAKALLTASRTSCKLAYMSSCIACARTSSFALLSTRINVQHPRIKTTRSGPDSSSYACQSKYHACLTFWH